MKDKRYTLINGRLIIDKPSPSNNDDGNYHCEAFNPYGRITSNIVTLSFGCESPSWNCFQNGGCL